MSTKLEQWHYYKKQRLQIFSLLGKYDKRILSYFMYYFLFFYYMTLTRKLNYVGKPKNNTCSKSKKGNINPCFRKDIRGRILRGGSVKENDAIRKRLTGVENLTKIVTPNSPGPPENGPDTPNEEGKVFLAAVAGITASQLESDEKINKIEESLTLNWEKLYENIEKVRDNDTYKSSTKNDLTKLVHEIVAVALLQSV
jgi:hypothetical protein